MIPPKKKAAPDMDALDEVMSGPAPKAAPTAPVPEDDAEAAPAPALDTPPPPAAPKGDPAELVASIQSQLDELSQLLG